jgi:hypothetical protein
MNPGKNFMAGLYNVNVPELLSLQCMSNKSIDSCELYIVYCILSTVRPGGGPWYSPAKS